MRRLYILRHAEAAMAGEDRARPLTAQGRKSAAALGRKMKANKYFPQYVVCSPARRTRETFAALEPFLPEVSCIFPEYLYNVSLEGLFKGVRAYSDSFRSALLVGHNPAIHELARSLGHKGDDKMVANLAGGYRAGTMTVIDCDADSWGLVSPDNCRLTDLLLP